MNNYKKLLIAMLFAQLITTKSIYSASSQPMEHFGTKDGASDLEREQSEQMQQDRARENDALKTKCLQYFTKDNLALVSCQHLRKGLTLYLQSDSKNQRYVAIKLATMRHQAFDDEDNEMGPMESKRQRKSSSFQQQDEDGFQASRSGSEVGTDASNEFNVDVLDGLQPIDQDRKEEDMVPQTGLSDGTSSFGVHSAHAMSMPMSMRGGHFQSRGGGQHGLQRVIPRDMRAKSRPGAKKHRRENREKGKTVQTKGPAYEAKLDAITIDIMESIYMHIIKVIDSKEDLSSTLQSMLSSKDQTTKSELSIICEAIELTNQNGNQNDNKQDKLIKSLNDISGAIKKNDINDDKKGFTERHPVKIGCFITVCVNVGFTLLYANWESGSQDIQAV